LTGLLHCRVLSFCQASSRFSCAKEEILMIAIARSASPTTPRRPQQRRFTTIASILGLLSVTAAGLFGRSARAESFPSCPGRVDLPFYGMTESPTRTWVAKAWFDLLRAKVPEINPSAFVPGPDDEAFVTVCVVKLTRPGKAASGLGDAKGAASAKLVIVSTDGVMRTVLLFDPASVKIGLPPAVTAAGLEHDATKLGMFDVGVSVLRYGNEAPAEFRKLANQHWSTNMGASISFLTRTPAQPGFNRVDEFLWVDDCGTVEGTVTANEKLTFQQGQNSGCPKTDALRKAVLSGTPTIKAGRSGTFTLKSGRQTLTLMPSGNPDFGAPFSNVRWSITSWKEAGKLPRASAGSLYTSGTTLSFGGKRQVQFEPKPKSNGHGLRRLQAFR
jgi:hypothetical protein